METQLTEYFDWLLALQLEAQRRIPSLDVRSDSFHGEWSFGMTPKQVVDEIIDEEDVSC